MTTRNKKLDLNKLAASIVGEATGEIEPEIVDEKKKAAIESGRLGGLKGGKARAEKLTPEQLTDIANITTDKK